MLSFKYTDSIWGDIETMRVTRTTKFVDIVSYLIRYWSVSTLAAVWYLFVAAAIIMDPSAASSSSLVRYIDSVLPGSAWWPVPLMLIVASLSGLWFALSESRLALFSTVTLQIVMVATVMGVLSSIITGISAGGVERSRAILIIAFSPVLLIACFHAYELITIIRLRFSAGLYNKWKT